MWSREMIGEIVHNGDYIYETQYENIRSHGFYGTSLVSKSKILVTLFSLQIWIWDVP
jgi:hypothetical protein